MKNKKCKENIVELKDWLVLALQVKDILLLYYRAKIFEIQM